MNARKFAVHIPTKILIVVFIQSISLCEKMPVIVIIVIKITRFLVFLDSLINNFYLLKNAY